MRGGDVDEVFEAQYNLRRGHPQREQVYARYEDLSAAFRATANSRCDVPYGGARRQVLDISRPGMARRRREAS